MYRMWQKLYEHFQVLKIPLIKYLFSSNSGYKRAELHSLKEHFRHYSAILLVPKQTQEASSWQGGSSAVVS